MRGWKRQVHASHDEYFVCTAVIFSTVFDVSIATYDVYTVQLLYIYACVRIIIAVPLHCRYVNGIYEECNEKAVYHALVQGKVNAISPRLEPHY